MRTQKRGTVLQWVTPRAKWGGKDGMRVKGKACSCRSPNVWQENGIAPESAMATIVEPMPAPAHSALDSPLNAAPSVTECSPIGAKGRGAEEDSIASSR